MSRIIARMGMLAGVYVALTLVFAPISYGPVQVRVSEALTLLPFYYGPQAAVGLWIGAMISNAFGGLGILDMTFGAALTLVAGLLTSQMPNRLLAAAPPVVVNAVGIGWMLHYLLGVPLLATMAYVGTGQAVAVVFIGLPAIHWLVHRLEERGWSW